MSFINTHYDILKISRNASAEAIQDAYEEALQRYPQNKSLSNEEENSMGQVKAAYAQLKDPAGRKIYDNWVNKQESEYMPHTGFEKNTPHHKHKDHSSQNSEPTENKGLIQRYQLVFEALKATLKTWEAIIQANKPLVSKLFVAICVSALIVSFWGTSKIGHSCVMNGLGSGSCSFTNTGDDSGAVCGSIQVEKMSYMKKSASNVFCSGEVKPFTTSKVDFSIPGVRDDCPSGLVDSHCTFIFIEQ